MRSTGPITVAVPLLGLLLFLPAAALLVFLNAVFYVAIHLRYDTTWYVISAAVISTLVILRLPETAHKELA